MPTVRELFDVLCEFAPLELQMDFDNAGFQVGRGQAEVHTVLLSLDITDAVIDEAISMGAELIVSHHPLIFSPLRDVTDLGSGEKALRLAEVGIAAISMHTNLDIAEGGVNDVLLAALGARKLELLDPENCGRIGVLDEELPLEEFLARVKRVLNVEGLRYVSGGKGVKRLAVLGGGGGSSLPYALDKGCDTFVTADIKYHQFLEAAEKGINLIDADHFCTENPVIPVLARRLSERFPEIRFCVSKRHHALIRFA